MKKLIELAGFGVCGDWHLGVENSKDEIPQDVCEYNDTCHYRVNRGYEVCSDINARHCQAYKMFLQEKGKT